MRVGLLLAGLVLCLALAPGAGAGDPLRLVPEWPESFEEARSEQIRLLPGPPIDDEDRHGPVLPGSTTAGTSHSFHWFLENPDGSPGPAGDLALAAEQPVVLEVYLSPDADTPEAGPQVPAAPDAGLAPELTVEATLEVGGGTLGPERSTRTLAATPLEETGEAVTRYELVFEPDRDLVPAGSGLGVDLAVYQANASGQHATQPAWTIHTGAQHPTGLTLPLETDPDGDTGPHFALQTSGDGSTEAVRTGAYATLAAAIGAAGWAARRGYRQLSGD